jgi:hypothetical protein
VGKDEIGNQSSHSESEKSGEGEKTVCVFCVLILMALTGLAWAQEAKTTRLPNGLEIYDLSGEWYALIEPYGQATATGLYTNVVKLTVNGVSCPVTGQLTDPLFITGVRLQNDPSSPKPASAGSEIIRGELEGKGFAHLEIITGDKKVFPSTGKISENENKIIIDSPNYARMTLTRR